MTVRVLDIVLTEADFLRRSALMARRIWTHPVALAIAVIWIGAAGLALSFPEWRAVGIGLAVGGLIGGWIGYRAQKREAQREFQRSTPAGHRMQFAWDAEGCTVTGATGSSIFRWQELYAWDADDAVVLIALTPGLTTVLPARAFPNETARADLLAAMQAAGLPRSNDYRGLRRRRAHLRQQTQPLSASGPIPPGAIRARLGTGDLLRAAVVYWRLSMRDRIWLFGPILALTALMSALSLYGGMEVLPALMPVLVIGLGLPLAGLALMLVLMPVLYRRSAYGGVAFDLSWDSDELTVAYTRSRTGYRWDDLLAWEDRMGLVMLFLAPNLALMLPRRVLPADRLQDLRAQLVQAGVPRRTDGRAMKTRFANRQTGTAT